MPVSSSVSPLLCKGTMQAVRQLVAQIKITQFCFRSCLYFTSFVSEHLINKSKWTITSSKQACSEIPESIKSQGKQVIASDAWVLGILAILGNISLFTQISLIAHIFIVRCSLVSRQNQRRLFQYGDSNFAWEIRIVLHQTNNAIPLFKTRAKISRHLNNQMHILSSRYEPELAQTSASYQ